MQKIIDRGHYVEVPVPEDAFLVKAGAPVQLSCVLTPEDQALPHQSFVLEAGASLDLCIVVMPGVSAELPVSINLVGEGAEVFLSGIYLGRGEQKVTFRVDMRHKVGGCTSRQLFKGIASDQSRAFFGGRIVVAPDAMGTKAFQESHNILLSADARVETRPQLEIYADDVECSHGATVGSFNADELFYMRSRGIPEEEARRLQLISFLSPVLDHLHDDTAREKVLAAL